MSSTQEPVGPVVDQPAAGKDLDAGKLEVELTRMRRSMRTAVMSAAVGATIGAGAIITVAGAVYSVVGRPAVVEQAEVRKSDQAQHRRMSVPAVTQPVAAQATETTGAAPASAAPTEARQDTCDGQTWPYLDKNCLKRVDGPTTAAAADTAPARTPGAAETTGSASSTPAASTPLASASLAPPVSAAMASPTTSPANPAVTTDTKTAVATATPTPAVQSPPQPRPDAARAGAEAAPTAAATAETRSASDTRKKSDARKKIARARQDHRDRRQDQDRNYASRAGDEPAERDTAVSTSRDQPRDGYQSRGYIRTRSVDVEDAPSDSDAVVIPSSRSRSRSARSDDGYAPRQRVTVRPQPEPDARPVYGVEPRGSPGWRILRRLVRRAAGLVSR